MTPRAISLIQSSFAKIKPVAPQFGALFCQKIFQIAPELRPVFQTNVSDKDSKLMDILATAVSTLHQPRWHSHVVPQLCKSHATCGITQEHFDFVNQALMHTLEQVLGNAFTQPVRQAWQSMFAELEITMGESIRVSDELKQVAVLRSAIARIEKVRPWWRQLIALNT